MSPHRGRRGKTCAGCGARFIGDECALCGGSTDSERDESNDDGLQLDEDADVLDSDGFDLERY